MIGLFKPVRSEEGVWGLVPRQGLGQLPQCNSSYMTKGNRMKQIKRIFYILLSMMMLSACAFAEDGINVTKKDINLNKALDKNVTNILVLIWRC